MEDTKTLQKQILEVMSKTELKQKYDSLVKVNEYFKTNKRMAYYSIARAEGIKLQVNIASSTKEAFPLSIADSKTDEKKNFNLAGYVIGEPRPFINSKGNSQMYLQIADESDTISISVFADQIDAFEEIEDGNFITLSNLYWKDKNIYNPSYGQYSSVSVTKETPYDLSKIKLTSVASLIDEKYFAIKGIIVDIPDNAIQTPFHCLKGHWFSGFSDSDLGTDTKCEKDNNEIMEVLQHTVGNGLLFADKDSQVYVNISVFAELQSIELLDEFILRGKAEMVDGTMIFNATYAKPLKKN